MAQMPSHTAQGLINRCPSIFKEPQAFIHPQLFLNTSLDMLGGCTRTFSTRPPTRRRWGTRAGTFSSAPPLRSLCTWRWSWATTGGPVPSRTPRLCSRSPRRSGRPCRASESPCSWVAWGLKEHAVVLRQGSSSDDGQMGSWNVLAA